jgi:hypothetical protein
MYELKKMERYLRVNLFGSGPSSYEKIIYRAAVSQRLANTVLYHEAGPRRKLCVKFPLDKEGEVKAKLHTILLESVECFLALLCVRGLNVEPPDQRRGERVRALVMDK